MWGRFIGLLAGLALLAEAYVLWRPEAIGALPSVDLGPYTQYRVIIAGLAAAVGIAVLIASALRPRSRRRERPSIDWGAPVAPPPGPR